jgi:hypothetical protein
MRERERERERESVGGGSERHYNSGEDGNISLRLFLPICLMYYYSLQIKNGIQNKTKQKKNYFLFEGSQALPASPSEAFILKLLKLEVLRLNGL